MAPELDWATSPLPNGRTATPSTASITRPVADAVYRYLDEGGNLIYEVVRKPGKRFVQRRPGAGDGEWLYNLDRIERVPYRLPELCEALARGGETVVVVEGEKGVDALRSLDITATTSSGGAAWRWPSDWAERYFRGFAAARVIADNDGPGRKAARERAELLAAVVPDVRLVERLPGVPDGGDVSDFLEHGRSLDELWRALEDGEQVAAVPAADSAPDSLGRIGASPRDSDSPGGRGRSSVGGQLTAFVDELRAEGSLDLFHDPTGDPYATLGPPRSSAVRTFALDTKTFERTVLGMFHARLIGTAAAGRTPTAQAWADVVRCLGASACYEGRAREVFLRTAALDDRVLIDLADETGRAIEVTATGWRLTDRPDVRFRRAAATQPLPEPTRGAPPDTLRRYLNVIDADYPVVLAWLVNALGGAGPFPVLLIHGEQGSAKTTTARFCRSLVDPVVAPLRALPHDERDLAIAAYNSRVLGFDNLSGIPTQMSDALCRIASGEGFGSRTLYTNREEHVFAGARPILATGIAPPASRPDLLDRSYVIEAPRITDEARRDERSLLADFERDRPAMLGFLLGGLSAALAGRAGVVLDRPPRMVDAARWAVAASPGLGVAQATMVTALELTRDSATDAALEASPFAEALIGFVGGLGEDGWRGTSTQLLDALAQSRPESESTSRGWPQNARGARAELTRVAPSLRRRGLAVTFLGKTGHDGRRLIEIGPDLNREGAR